jgi:hypothetical protein
MFAADLVFIVIFALVLSVFLTWAVGWRHPAESRTAGLSILFLFIILMFTMWAGSAWIPPWGPVFFGSAWLSLLVIGLIIALLVLAVSEPVRRPKTLEVVEENTAGKPVERTTPFGMFFWILLLVLLLAIVLSYIL